MTDLSSLNWLAILVAAFAHMVIAGIWYGPIFGQAWMDENGFKAEDLADNSKGAMLRSTISYFILALGMAYLMPAMGLSGWFNGAYMGAAMAVFIHGTAGYPNYTFEMKSNKLFFIHLGNSVLGMAAMGAILGAM